MATMGQRTGAKSAEAYTTACRVAGQFRFYIDVYVNVMIAFECEVGGASGPSWAGRPPRPPMLKGFR